MRIAVTGAHGFVGSHVVDTARASGVDVVALLSPWGRDDSLTHHRGDPGVTFRRADITSPTELQGVVDGCDAVVHAAARVADHGPWEAFERANVRGTRHVLEAAQRSGVPRFVFVSSVAVWQYSGFMDADPRRRPRDEHTLPYGRSKRLGEDLVYELAPEPVIVRPGLWPYGRRDPTLARIARALRRGVFPLLDGGRAHLQTVDVQFLATVLLTACHHPGAAGQAYLVADEGAPTWRDVMTQIADILGVQAPRLALPSLPLRAAATLVERVWQALPGSWEPPITRYRAKLMLNDVVFLADAVERELGVTPTRSRARALRRALDGEVAA